MSLLIQMVKTCISEPVSSEYTIYPDTLFAIADGNLIDLSPTSRQVTNSGLTTTIQQNKKCFYINGAGASYTPFSLPGDFTIDANVLFTSTSDMIQLINYEIASSFRIAYTGFTSWKDGSNDYGTGLAIPTYSFSPSLNLNTWYNIRWVKSGKTFYMYLDKVLVNQVTVNNIYPITTNHFGWNQYSSSKGYFSHLVISSRAYII